ncbi:HAD family hydrolase [Faecalicoccus pleomorphus]|uniref:HAD family hydrolase n=1 Tax=Faecalicoccus pleomorphus TaxID=1323 RepID=A0A7X9NGL5_9FIRM|nr:HAD family hydrolase [Faecalicoccus pleomorphus]NME43877.1 HAD family hydrolase [Faecalicoccus pleomorphus]
MKIIFLDADGTLLHHEGFIPQSALQACQLAQKNGHKIVLCTGRQKVEVYGDMLKLDYDGMITGSGAHVEVNHQLLEERTFSKEQLQILLEYMCKNDIDAIFETTEGLVGNQKTYDHLDQMIQKQCKHLSPELFAKHGLVQVQHNLKVTDAILEYPVNKISFLESDISYQEIYDALHRQFDLVPATFAPFGKESGEISEKTITKATGMQSILNYFDRSAEDAIAIGDGFNDLCMFEVAKTSVAMGNAPIEVQKKADRVTTSLDNNGIYNAFIVLGLIE